DLAQLYADLEHRDEVLHELAEVHPRLGREIEEHLRLLEEVVRGDELHGEVARGYLLPAGIEGLLLALAIGLYLAEVVFGGDPLDGHDLVLPYLPGLFHDALQLAYVPPVAGGDDHHRALRDESQ